MDQRKKDLIIFGNVFCFFQNTRSSDTTSDPTHEVCARCWSAWTLVHEFGLTYLITLKPNVGRKEEEKKNAKKLIHEIVFHPSSELSTGCSSTHVSSLSCQHSATPFSLIQPLFICLTFSVSTLHQDSSAPPLTQELYAFRT